MKMKWVIAALCVAGVAVATPAAAQKVKVDSTGVTVTDEDGKTVKVDHDGNTVTTDESEVKTADDGVTVKKKTKKQKKQKTEKASKSVKTDKKHQAAVFCALNDDVTIKDRHVTGDVTVEVRGSCDIDIEDSVIEAKKTGAAVSGSGDITIKNSKITSDDVGIAVAGSGDVELDGVELTGNNAAIRISGTGEVKAKNCKIKGKMIITGTGKFIDGGGNTLIE